MSDAEPKYFPAGHFYSPYPNLGDIERWRERIFDRSVEPAGIDLRLDEQKDLLERLLPFYRDIPYGPKQADHLRYSFENGMFSYSDGVLLYLLLRHLQPARIVEVGSGWTSALTLDTMSGLDAATTLTFIEPYTDRLMGLLSDADRASTTIIEAPLQDAPLDAIADLEAGDVLFIDSTHVSKAGSDVNMLLFDVIPSVAPGVYIHLHDIFYPFEYPEKWILEGRSWTEDYLLRAFLQYNESFEIVLFGHMMHLFHGDWLAEHMPLTRQNLGGSFWMRRVR